MQCNVNDPTTDGPRLGAARVRNLIHDAVVVVVAAAAVAARAATRRAVSTSEREGEMPGYGIMA